MVARTVDQLVAMSLAAEAGEWLGSEADLLRQLGISRPTLRQAAKVVENDQLLSVRRGVNGGFYAVRPDARHAIQAPALWLRLQSATLDQMNRANALIFPEVAASAARCTDPGLIAELRRFRDGIDARIEHGERDEVTVRAEIELVGIVTSMADDPVLRLFLDICYSFGVLEPYSDHIQMNAQRRRAWLQMQRGFCDAILAGDPEAARRFGRSRGMMVANWFKDDSEPDPALEPPSQQDGDGAR